MSVCSPADEVRRLLIVFRRKLLALKQRSTECIECIDMVIGIIAELEARLEEYEYEEALKRWG
ncbi:MAG: hypothetical protein QXW41_09130 [Fervidicoccaceae archaeon]